MNDFDDQIRKEVDEMTDSIDSPTLPGQDELRTDSPSTDAPGTEAPGTDAPSTDAPSTDAPTTDAPAEDPRDAELRELREKVEALEGKQSTDPPPTQSPSTEAPLSDEDFIGDMDLDDLSRDPSQLNTVLNKIYKRAVEHARTEIRTGDEAVMRSMPDIIKHNISLETELKKAKDDFYEKNEDLLPFNKVVAAVFEELAAEQPGKSFTEILPDVAKETRKRLDLSKRSTQPGNDDDPPPLQKSKRGKRQTPKPDPTPLQNELDDMDRVLDL